MFVLFFEFGAARVFDGSWEGKTGSLVTPPVVGIPEPEPAAGRSVRSDVASCSDGADLLSHLRFVLSFVGRSCRYGL